jgi:hypothetical protein
MILLLLILVLILLRKLRTKLKIEFDLYPNPRRLAAANCWPLQQLI